MSDIGREMIRGLSGFARKLKSGEPILVTRVERVSHVPGAEEHVFTKMTLDEVLKDKTGKPGSQDER